MFACVDVGASRFSSVGISLRNNVMVWFDIVFGTLRLTLFCFAFCWTSALGVYRNNDIVGLNCNFSDTN